MGTLRSGDRVQDGTDLVDSLVLVAADLELDQCGVPVLRSVGRVSGLERRADVAERPRLGDRARRHPRSPHRRRIVPTRCERLWIKTLSAAGCSKPASRIRSIRPDSPGPAEFGSMFFVPTAPPSPKATRTKASQPNVAVFQWSALQRPMRAARLRSVCLVRDMRVPPSGVAGLMAPPGDPNSMAATLGALPRGAIVGRPDSRSHLPTIRAPTRRRSGLLLR